MARKPIAKKEVKAEAKELFFFPDYNLVATSEEEAKAIYLANKEDK